MIILDSWQKRKAERQLKQAEQIDPFNQFYPPELALAAIRAAAEPTAPQTSELIEALESLTIQDISKLIQHHQPQPLTQEDFVEIVDLSSPNSSKLAARLINNMSQTARIEMQQAYLDSLKEWWEATTKPRGESWPDFLRRYLQGQDTAQLKNGLLVVDKLHHRHQRLPKEYRELLYSRLSTLFSPAERTKLASSTVVIFGCSTASEIVRLLRQAGVGKLIVVDPDTIAISNLTRLASSNLRHRKHNKAIHIASEVINIDPMAKIDIYAERLSLETLLCILSQADFVFEAIDDPGYKALIRFAINKLRQLQTNEPALNVPLYLDMATNNEGAPQNAIETIGDPPFLRPQLTEAELKQLAIRTPENFVKAVTVIVQTKHIPPRQMVGFILMAKGELNFIPQHGVSAALSGSLATETAIKLLLGAKLKNSETQINMHTMLDPSSLDELDSQYFGWLKIAYPPIFGPYPTLRQALEDLTRNIFGVAYTYPLTLPSA